MTSHVVHISTNVTQGCEHCQLKIGGDDFAESVNHYVSEHSYNILHIGTETRADQNGKPWHSTIAVLGK
jgi:hypothetical protein